MEIDTLLVNESQLGAQLNHCVHEKRRSDFSLMLAMLSQDVRDFSEFQQDEEKKAEQINTDNDLRSFFELPDPEPLALKSLEDVPSFNQAATVESELFDDVRLSQCIAPKPLSFRDDKSYIPTQIKANLSLCQQHRLAHQDEGSIASPQPANVASWLKNVKTAMAKSASISLHSIA